MDNLYLGADPRTAGECHISKFDKCQYCGPCEEFFAFYKDERTPNYLNNSLSKEGSTGCRSDISRIPSLSG